MWLHGIDRKSIPSSASWAPARLCQPAAPLRAPCPQRKHPALGTGLGAVGTPRALLRLGGCKLTPGKCSRSAAPGSPPPHPEPWDGPGAHPAPGSWQQSGSTQRGQVLEAALHPAGAARWRPGLIRFRGRRLHPPNHHHCHHLRPARPGGETETQRDLSEMIV